MGCKGTKATRVSHHNTVNNDKEGYCEGFKGQTHINNYLLDNNVCLDLLNTIVDESPSKSTISWRWASPSLVFCYMQYYLNAHQHFNHIPTLFIYSDEDDSALPFRNEATKSSWFLTSSALLKLPKTQVSLDASLRRFCDFNSLILLGELPKSEVLNTSMEQFLKALVRAKAKPKSVHVLSESLSAFRMSHRYGLTLLALDCLSEVSSRTTDCLHIDNKNNFNIYQSGGLYEVIPPALNKEKDIEISLAPATFVSHDMGAFCMFVGTALSPSSSCFNLTTSPIKDNENSISCKLLSATLIEDLTKLGIVEIVALCLNDVSSNNCLFDSDVKKNFFNGITTTFLLSQKVANDTACSLQKTHWTPASVPTSIVVDLCMRCTNQIVPVASKKNGGVLIIDDCCGYIASLATLWFLVEIGNNEPGVAVEQIRRKFIPHVEVPARIQLILIEFFACLNDELNKTTLHNAHELSRKRALEIAMSSDKTDEYSAQKQGFLQEIAAKDNLKPSNLELQKSLAVLQNTLSSTEYQEMCRIIILIVENVLRHPTEQHYRTIKLSNHKFRSTIGHRKEAVSLLEYCKNVLQRKTIIVGINPMAGGWRQQGECLCLLDHESLEKLQQLLVLMHGDQ